MDPFTVLTGTSSLLSIANAAVDFTRKYRSLTDEQKIDVGSFALAQLLLDTEINLVILEPIPEEKKEEVPMEHSAYQGFVAPLRLESLQVFLVQWDYFSRHFDSDSPRSSWGGGFEAVVAELEAKDLETTKNTALALARYIFVRGTALKSLLPTDPTVRAGINPRVRLRNLRDASLALRAILRTMEPVKQLTAMREYPVSGVTNPPN